MINMYRKDGKEVKVGFDQVKIMEEAGYTHEKPEVKKDEEMPAPGKKTDPVKTDPAKTGK